MKLNVKAKYRFNVGANVAEMTNGGYVNKYNWYVGLQTRQVNKRASYTDFANYLCNDKPKQVRAKRNPDGLRR